MDVRTEDFWAAFDGPEQPTGLVELPTAKIVADTHTFQVGDKLSLHGREGTFLILLTLKAPKCCTQVTVTICGGATAAVTYDIPVQWTRIGIPVKSTGTIHVTLVPQGPVLLAEARCECREEDTLKSLSVRTGMHLLEPFVDVTITDDGTILTGPTTDLIRRGRYLYAIGNGKLTVLDISVPQKPVVVSELDGLGDSVRQIAALEDGEHVLISSRENGCYIVNVSDPCRLRLVSRYDSVEMATGVDVSGHLAYICNRQYGVEIVDVQDVGHPVHLALVRCGTAQSCRVMDGILYVGCWNERCIQIIDVTDTSHPRPLGTAALHGKGDGMAVARVGDRICLFAATGHHIAGCGESLAGTTEERRLSNPAFGQGNGLDIFDVTDPMSPRWLSTSHIDGRYYFPHNDYWDVEIAQYGERVYAYYLNTYNGIYFFDVTDPAAPLRLGRVTVVSPRIEEQVFPQRACIFPYDQALRRQSPTAAIACGEGVLYIASAMTDLHVCAGTLLDPFLHPAQTGAPSLAKPTSGSFYTFDPDEAGLTGFAQYVPDGQVYAAAVYGDKIYAACGRAGIAVLDEDLHLMSSIPTKDIAMDVQVRDGVLFCAESAAGLGAYALSEDGLCAEELWRHRSSKGVVRQIRLSPRGHWALIQCGSCFGQVISSEAPHRLAAECESSTLMYHHNLLNTPAGNRYLAIYADGGQTFWYDFSDREDSPPALACCWPSNHARIVTGGMTGNVPGHPEYVLCTAGVDGGKPGGYVIYCPPADNTPVLTAVDPQMPFSGRPAIFGQLLVASDRINGKIHLVDISDLAAPKVLKTICTAGSPDTAVRLGRYLLIPMGYQGLFRFDMSPLWGEEETPCEL